jgi:YfiH family protein
MINSWLSIPAEPPASGTEKVKEIDLLARCNWLPAGKTARPLADLGIEHGFFGRDEVAPLSHHIRQIHGTKLVLAEDHTTGPGATRRVEADGLYTLTPGTTIAIKTADCLPVLGVASGKRAAFGLHAGWRGLTSGIIGLALAELANQGFAATDWTCVIGPAIGRESYEVGPEVIEALATGDIGLTPAQFGLATAKGRRDRWQLDTTVAGVFALCNAGVPAEKIAVVQADTYKEQAWYSYRREGKGVASNWSWVTL